MRGTVAPGVQRAELSPARARSIRCCRLAADGLATTSTAALAAGMYGLFSPCVQVVQGVKPPAPLNLACAALALFSPFSIASSMPNWGSELPGVICHSPHPVLA